MIQGQQDCANRMKHILWTVDCVYTHQVIFEHLKAFIFKLCSATYTQYRFSGELGSSLFCVYCLSLAWYTEYSVESIVCNGGPIYFFILVYWLLHWWHWAIYITFNSLDLSGTTYCKNMALNEWTYTKNNKVYSLMFYFDLEGKFKNIDSYARQTYHFDTAFDPFIQTAVTMPLTVSFSSVHLHTFSWSTICALFLVFNLYNRIIERW